MFKFISLFLVFALFLISCRHVTPLDDKINLPQKAIIGEDKLKIYNKPGSKEIAAEIGYKGVRTTITKAVFLPGVKKELWYYVEDTEGCLKNKICAGWIKSSDVVFENEFRKVKEFTGKQKSHYCIGEYCPVYSFNSDGTFIFKIAPYFLETRKELIDSCKRRNMEVKDQFCVTDGMLFEAKGIYWPRIGNESLSDTQLLVKDENGLLCFPFADGGCSEECVKGEPCYIQK